MIGEVNNVDCVIGYGDVTNLLICAFIVLLARKVSLTSALWSKSVNQYPCSPSISKGWDASGILFSWPNEDPTESLLALTTKFTSLGLLSFDWTIMSSLSTGGSTSIKSKSSLDPV